MLAEARKKRNGTHRRKWRSGMRRTLSAQRAPAEQRAGCQPTGRNPPRKLPAESAVYLPGWIHDCTSGASRLQPCPGSGFNLITIAPLGMGGASSRTGGRRWNRVPVDTMKHGDWLSSTPPRRIAWTPLFKSVPPPRRM